MNASCLRIHVSKALNADPNENIMQNSALFAVRVALQMKDLRLRSSVSKALAANTNGNIMQSSVVLAVRVAL